MENIKGKLFLVLFITTSTILALGIWNNYRPQIVYASCADIAEKTTNLIKKKDLVVNEDKTFDDALNDCLMDAGYYNNK